MSYQQPTNLLHNTKYPHSDTSSKPINRSYESEKQRLIESCFSKKDTSGEQYESYITHVRIEEDAVHPQTPPPVSSSSSNKKVRVIVVSVKNSGRVRIHKARENANGTFSIGKTWQLEDLTSIESFDEDSPSRSQSRSQRAGEEGFIVTLNKSYFWRAYSVEEKKYFITCLVKIYRKYTFGCTPKLIGFSPNDLAILTDTAWKSSKTPPGPLKSNYSSSHLNGPTPLPKFSSHERDRDNSPKNRLSSSSSPLANRSDHLPPHQVRDSSPNSDFSARNHDLHHVNSHRPDKHFRTKHGSADKALSREHKDARDYSNEAPAVSDLRQRSKAFKGTGSGPGSSNENSLNLSSAEPAPLFSKSKDASDITTETVSPGSVSSQAPSIALSAYAKNQSTFPTALNRTSNANNKVDSIASQKLSSLMSETDSNKPFMKNFKEQLSENKAIQQSSLISSKLSTSTTNRLKSNSDLNSVNVKSVRQLFSPTLSSHPLKHKDSDKHIQTEHSDTSEGFKPRSGNKALVAKFDEPIYLPASSTKDADSSRTLPTDAILYNDPLLQSSNTSDLDFEMILDSFFDVRKRADRLPFNLSSSSPTTSRSFDRSVTAKSDLAALFSSRNFTDDKATYFDVLVKKLEPSSPDRLSVGADAMIRNIHDHLEKIDLNSQLESVSVSESDIGCTADLFFTTICESENYEKLLALCCAELKSLKDCVKDIESMYDGIHVVASNQKSYFNEIQEKINQLSR